MFAYRVKTWIQFLKASVAKAGLLGNSIFSKRRSANYIRVISSWTPDRKEKIQLILKEMSSIASKAGIDLVLFYGSLLGHVRHGSIIPWDDDVDLIIDESDLDKFIKLISIDSQIRYKKLIYFREDLVYYKLWLDSGEYINSKDYTFPFVDLWIFRLEGQSDVRLSKDVLIWAADFYPVSHIEFEGAHLAIPRNAHSVLDMLYGNWRTKIQVHPWSHRLERPAFKPVEVMISVDSSGRIDSRTKRSLGID